MYQNLKSINVLPLFIRMDELWEWLKNVCLLNSHLLCLQDAIACPSERGFFVYFGNF